MGGKSGGGISLGDLRKLEEQAKASLKESQASNAKHVFISFAHEDINEINLLRGQAKNEKIDLVFDDHSVKEPYDSTNAAYIKRQIGEKISRVSVTVVYLTEHSASSKWVNWEIEESIRRGKGVIGVYKGGNPPTQLPSALAQNRCKVVKWSHEELAQAISHASEKRG